MNKLSDQEISKHLTSLKNWDLIDDGPIQKLKCIYKIKSYTQGLSLVNTIGLLVESNNHHPLIILEHASISIFWWTHTVNGLSPLDFEMAQKTAELFELIN